MKKLLRRLQKPAAGSENPRGVLTPASTTSGSAVDLPDEPVIAPVGIKELFRPDEGAVDIVFVHGLRGHRERTWTANTTLWPKTLLPSKIPNARVLTFGYDANVVQWGQAVSRSRVADHASNLLNGLVTHREEDNTNDRPIIFICHSLGGLVCEEALVISNDEPETSFKNIARLTKGILFLGTPHHGSSLAQWAASITRLVGIVHPSNHNIVQVLRNDSEVLARIQDRFHTMIRSRQGAGLARVEIACFYEELPHPGVGLVVPQESAIIPGYRSRGIHSNHADMGKFESVEDDGFKAICGELRRWIKTLPAQLGSSIITLNEVEMSCMALLSAFDVSDYIRQLPKPVKGTCNWILGHPKFTSWATDSATTLLWLTGHSGCGKTVLSTFLANHLEQVVPERGDAQVCIYACDDKVTRQKDAKSILQSFIYQIIRHHRSLVKYVKAVFEVQGPNLARSFSSLWNIFVRVASDPKSGTVYIILDAIDECAEDSRRLLLESIKDLIYGSELSGTPQSSIKFLLTSRPTISNSSTAPFVDSCVAIDESQHMLEADVRLVIHNKINELAKICGYDEKMKMDLEQTLYSKAGRTFLWVHMILKALETSVLHSQKDIQTIIDHLPSDLEETYASFLGNIPERHRLDGIKLLNLALGSSQPLKLHEMNIAFTITADDEFEDAVWSSRQPSMARTIQGILGPLMRISGDEVSLVHQSAKDFLLRLASQPDNPLFRHFNINPSTAAQTLASSCIYYLLLDDFSEDRFALQISPADSLSQSPSDEESPDAGVYFEHDPFSLEDATIFRDTRVLDKEICHTLSERHHFIDYAALHWFEHYSAAEGVVPPELSQAAMRLLDPKEACCTNWLRYYWAESKLNYDIPDQFDPILLAAYFNMPGILAELLGIDETYFQLGRDRALFWASAMGNDRAVKVLLAFHANPNAAILERQTALIVAAQNGHLACVQLLLSEPKIDINAQNLSGRTALSLACGYGYVEIFKALWTREDCQLDIPDKSGATPFFWAVGGGHKSIISTMLKNLDIKVDLGDKTGRTAISWAAGDGMEVPLKLLLKSSRVYPNVPDVNGRSPLSWAAGEGQSHTLEILLRSRRVERSSKDKNKRNPISWACGGGHEAALKLLIEYGCPGIDDVDVDGWSPLAWALQQECAANIVALVSSKQVDIERRDRGGNSILGWAIAYGHKGVVKALVDAGVDLESKDDKGRAALDMATFHKRKDLVDFIRSAILRKAGNNEGQSISDKLV
ncbi:hypothetical protein GQ53DRAFT_128407 [Thozetella sp. PMI_491]|nr:hypothetical protein GQ53DRAFT_128407 [Thozetella sp. PMI_491]